MPATNGHAAPKTREPQYQFELEMALRDGFSRFGIYSNQTWKDDPRRLVFMLSRYKFVAKMLGGKARVVEVGCSDGFGARLVMQEGCRVTITDFDPLFVAELRRAQQEYYALGVRIRATARAVQDRIAGERDRALYYRDILLPLRERIVNEAQLYYNAMQIGVLQLLRDREQQIETAVGFVDALREYWLARTDLSQLASGRLPNGRGVRERERRAADRDDDRRGH